MTTHRFLAPRMILAGGFAMAALAGPAVTTAFSAPPDTAVATCPPGESADIYLTTCVPDVVPNSPPPFTTIAGNPDIPAIGGIPCAGHNSGQCIGLAEEQQAQGPAPVPQSTVSSSP